MFKSRLTKNILSLSAAEAATKVFTLLYQIYLARILSPAGFGKITFAQTIILYLSSIMILGVEIFGTRQIAKNHGNLNEMVNNATSYKLLGSILMYAILTFIVLLVDEPLEIKLILLIAGANLFTNAFNLLWAFQGIEKMGIIALRQIITSGLSLCAIILLVNDESDTLLSMGILSTSLLLNALWMFFYYIKKYGSFKFTINLPFWKEMMRSAAPIGISMLVVAVYNYLNIILVTFIKGTEATGIYSAAFRVMSLALVPSAILQGSFFPLFSRLTDNKERLAAINKFFFLLMLSAFFFAFTIFNFSDFILVALGSKYHGAQDVLKLMMVSLILMYLNITYSAPLLAWHKEKQVMYSIIAGGIVNIASGLLLITYFGIYGAAFSTILSETAVLVGLSYTFKKLTGKLMFYHLAKFLLISVIAGAPAYIMLYMKMNVYFAGSVSFGIFLLFLIFDKDVNIKELKGALKG